MSGGETFFELRSRPCQEHPKYFHVKVSVQAGEMDGPVSLEYAGGPNEPVSRQEALVRLRAHLHECIALVDMRLRRELR